MFKSCSFILLSPIHFLLRFVFSQNVLFVWSESMYNKEFHATSVEEKRCKLKKIILSRHPAISFSHMEQILSAVDYEKQYNIKVTRRIEKFKNIITNERIQTSEKDVCSSSVSIYGSFTPGFYENYYGEIKQVPSIFEHSLEAAAIKITKEKRHTVVKSIYTLVIFISEG